MKRILTVLFSSALLLSPAPGQEVVHYSGHLIKYDQPAGTPKAMFCLRHPQSHLSALWLVGVDLNQLTNGTYILVEGVIHTKYIPSEGIESSIPDKWEVWMGVKRYRVINDVSEDLNKPIAEPSDTTKIGAMLSACIPTNWTVSPVMEPVPVWGLSNPVAQFMLTENSRIPRWELSSGRTNTFSPTLVLLVFPIARAEEIDNAVGHFAMRSDYPPVVFCLNSRYIFVTSPGYINRGLHTREAEASLNNLRDALSKCMTVKYNEPEAASDWGSAYVPGMEHGPAAEHLSRAFSQAEAFLAKQPFAKEYARRACGGEGERFVDAHFALQSDVTGKTMGTVRIDTRSGACVWLGNVK